MKQAMPQEIEVWYLLPALRREITKIMIEEYHLTQKQVANYLGVTEAAISQYVKSKRAGEIQFTKEDTKKIKKTAQRMIEHPKSIVRELYTLSKSFQGNKVLCTLHKAKDKSLPKKCDICMK